MATTSCSLASNETPIQPQSDEPRPIHTAAEPGETPSSTTPATGPTSTPAQPQDSSPAAEAHVVGPTTSLAWHPGEMLPPPPPQASFSYSVLPRSGGGAQQSSSAPAPVMKLAPAVPAAALQPPVPGHYIGNRPSFSYNIVSHSNANLPPGQQFQLNTAPNQAMQGSRFLPPTALQPPVPVPFTRPNTMFPGPVAHGPPAPVRFPFPTLPRPANVPLVGAQQAESGASHNQSPSNTGTLDAGGSKGNAMDANSQAMQSQTSLLPSSVTSGANAAGNSTSVSVPMNPSLQPHPGAFGVVGPSILGQPSSQQHFYPTYPTAPAMVPPSHPMWAQPPQVTALQGPPLQSYPGPASPFTMPIAGATLSSNPLPNFQAPSVLTFGDPKESASANLQTSQPLNALAKESPSTDHDTQANDLQKEEGSVKAHQLDAWSAHKTETGVVYYHNTVTRESTYQRPASFKGELEKITSQSVPVSWEKLTGTDWSLVTTNDGKKYYYDNKNKVSSWQLPPDVAELTKNIGNSSLKGSAALVRDAGNIGEKAPTTDIISTPAAQTGGRDSVPLRQSVAPQSPSALDLIKKKLQEAGASNMPSTLPASFSGASELNGSKADDEQQGTNNNEKSKDANGEGKMSDSSSDSDDEENELTKQECILQFKEMLKERGVAPFSKWEKELPKILFDPRFQAVPNQSTRRAIFEHYVKTRAEEERKEKKAALKAAVEAFKKLLDEASEDINHKTSYQEFKRKWGSDARFEALDRREREALFNEKVKAAKEKMQAMHNAVVTSFKSMLRENKEITSNSRWSRVKESFRGDPRYKDVKREEREVLFNEYISELKSAENEAERAAKAKIDEQEKLREREREMRKRKEREEQEMERVKLKIRRKEVVSSYQALLVEMIKDPKASWTESKPKLDKDPQGRATNPELTQGDAEKLFRDHVKDLYERCARDFRALLAEVITPEAAARTTEEGKTVVTSWSEAKRLLKPDPRYSKLSSSDRETLWRRYADDMTRKLKQSDTKEKSDTEGRNNRASSSDPSRRR